MSPLFLILASITLPSTENLVLIAMVGVVSAVATYLATRYKTNRTVNQKEIDSIIKANADLREFITNQLKSLQDEYNILDKKATALENKVREYEEEIQRLTQKIDEQHELIKEYKTGKEEAERKADKLRKEVEALRVEVNSLRLENDHKHDNEE